MILIEQKSKTINKIVMKTSLNYFDEILKLCSFCTKYMTLVNNYT